MSKPAILQLEIVSAEKHLFKGDAEMVFVTGEMGDLGIAPGHAQLLTKIKPCYVRALLPNNQEEVFYISSGLLEVQPYTVSILADTALRAHDIDEAAAIAAKEQAEKDLADKAAKLDFAKAAKELAEAMAQIRAIERIRKRLKS